MLNELTKNVASSQIISAITNYGGEIRLIGGCVRDALINKKIEDIDFATTLLPDDVEKALTTANIKSIPTGKSQGTISALIDKTLYEITTLRKDVKTDGRKALVKYTDNWQVDAERRDFTINAMSYNPLTSTLYDYFNGQKHLKEGVVKFVGDPEKRVKEDYLRILRYYRFNALFGKKIDYNSSLACRNNAAKILNLSSERKYNEFLKIIATKQWLEIFQIMFKDKILKYFFNFDIKEYNLLVLQRLYNFNPLQKPNIILYILAEDCYLDLAKNFKLSNKQTNNLKKIHACIHEKKLEHDYEKYIYLYGKEIYYDALKIYSAHKNNFLIYKNITDKTKDWFPPLFPLNGKKIKDYFSIKEGVIIGELLNKAKDFWLNNKMKISQENLLTYLENNYK